MKLPGISFLAFRSLKVYTILVRRFNSRKGVRLPTALPEPSKPRHIEIDSERPEAEDVEGMQKC
jgi:hypothetical protein